MRYSMTVLRMLLVADYDQEHLRASWRQCAAFYGDRLRQSLPTKNIWFLPQFRQLWRLNYIFGRRVLAIFQRFDVNKCGFARISFLNRSVLTKALKLIGRKVRFPLWA